MAKFKIGDRVRKIETCVYVNRGATGTVDEDNSTIPFVKWDSGDMIADGGKSYLEWKINGKLAVNESGLELITDEPQQTEVEYEEVRVPFDFERWKKGDYVRVETNDGREVTELRHEEKARYPLKGIECGVHLSWEKDGSCPEIGNNRTDWSLSLIVLQPRVKEERPTLKVDNCTMQSLNITDDRVVKSATVNPSTFVMGSPLNELVVNFEGYTLTVEGNKATFTKTTQQ